MATLHKDATSVRARTQQSKTTTEQVSGNEAVATRVVYRPVLDNPLLPQWPTLTQNATTEILEALLTFLTSSPSTLPISEWRLQEHARRRGRTHGAGKLPKEPKVPRDPKVKAPKPKELGGPVHQLTTRSSTTYTIPTANPQPVLPTSAKPKPPPLPRPDILDHLLIGINVVTKSLELQLHHLLGTELLPRLPSASPDTSTGDKKRRRRPHSKSAPAAPSLPEAAGDLASHRFLSQPILTPRTRLPERLQPPKDASNFFSEFARTEREQLEHEKMDTLKGVMGPGHKKRRLEALLGEVISPSDPGQANAKKVQKVTPLQPKKVGPSKASEPLGSRQPVVQLPTPTPTSILFVCRGDLNPQSLVAHLPSMVSTLNGVIVQQQHTTAENSEGGDEPKLVLLVALPEGSEQVLADALGLRRVACISISNTAPALSDLLSVVASHIEPLDAPTTRFVSTHIKHYKTTAPLDPKASNTAKKEAKKARKEGKELFVAMDE